MMQAGVCLRQDTETTLPELTEQHRIRLKEEELSGLESETECAAPGLNTLEPECVTAHSGGRLCLEMKGKLIQLKTGNATLVCLAQMPVWFAEVSWTSDGKPVTSGVFTSAAEQKKKTKPSV
ncbi:hypothetical protein COCON_G00020660 [Conger conger]|uniref:Ig-like domain-containing protein n=1 Tax=Conger conger TaxID=82655 RepID=A0A9Q1I662_CONCO|nr:hypothetical protein COCON_G00020660 [Conger conger]